MLVCARIIWRRSKIETERGRRLTGLLEQLFEQLFVKMLSTPFGRMFPGMPVEHGKVPLSADASKVSDE
jgi:hypothetical protein